MSLLKVKIDKLRRYLRTLGIDVDIAVIQSKEALKYMLSEIYSPPPEEVATYRIVLNLDSEALEIYTSPLEYYRVKEVYGGENVKVYAVSTNCGEVPLDMNCIDRNSADAEIKDKLKTYKHVAVDDVSICEDIVCIDIRNAIKYIRRSKSDEELEIMKRAAEIAEKAINTVASMIEKDFSEIRIASMIESIARDLGAEGFAFTAIVAIGENTAKPHHIPTRKVYRGYEPILIDFGVRIQGYVSDVTRILIPKSVDKNYRELIEIIDNAKNEAISAIKSGVLCKDVDSIARSRLRERNLSNFFIHGLGHGVGVDVHEEPRLSPNSKDRLTEGDVVTVEPGVYIYGRYGVRIEDIVQVTKSGANILTKGVKVIEL
jgi:Xaa-Pro aminopeptidase